MSGYSQLGAMKEKKIPIIEVSNLHVNRSNSVVIENANFTINKGDYVGIVGPNGGGKTTLILSLLNILSRTKGTIRFFGQDISCARAPRIFTKIHIKYIVRGNNIVPEALEKAIGLSEEKYCSVGGMLKETVEITSSFKILE
jgi:ABC-type cobalamin/Fe3+-siderophores transport system ATPase subunit